MIEKMVWPCVPFVPYLLAAFFEPETPLLCELVILFEDLNYCVNPDALPPNPLAFTFFALLDDVVDDGVPFFISTAVFCASEYKFCDSPALSSVDPEECFEPTPELPRPSLDCVE